MKRISYFTNIFLLGLTTITSFHEGISTNAFKYLNQIPIPFEDRIEQNKYLQWYMPVYIEEELRNVYIPKFDTPENSEGLISDTYGTKFYIEYNEDGRIKSIRYTTEEGI